MGQSTTLRCNSTPTRPELLYLLRKCNQGVAQHEAANTKAGRIEFGYCTEYRRRLPTLTRYLGSLRQLPLSVPIGLMPMNLEESPTPRLLRRRTRVSGRDPPAIGGQTV